MEERRQAASMREALCGLALQLDSLDGSARALALAHTSSRLYSLASALCIEGRVESAVPLALLSLIIPTMLQEGQAAALVMQPLIDMLQTTQEASAHALELYAEVCLAHPAYLLPEVCAKLQAIVPSQRANAMGVLTSAARQLAAWRR